MNSEEIKVGNYYKIDARIAYKTKERNYGVTIMYPNGINSTVEFTPSEAALAFCNNSAKYDPTRLFKKGDIVRLKDWNGRCPALPKDWKFDNELFKVHEDEKFNSSVEITRENSKTVYIAPICFVELVTPVEELGPYSVHESEVINCFDIMRENMCVMTFPYGSKEDGFYRNKLAAKEAAEAERDRLNEAHREEQNNA